MQIAASVEAQIVEPHTIYYPSNILLYMQEGQLSLQLSEQTHVVSKGAFALIRKYTNGACFKTWGEDETCARMIVFVLQDKFLQNVIQNVSVKSNSLESVAPLVHLPYNTLLKGLMGSVETYVEGSSQLDRPMVELKTMEALMAIAKSRPDLLSVLKQYARPERADLETFMQYNFMYNIPLEKLARMTGRSLSTFNRAFKGIYQQSPHKWIKQQRLEMAKRLLVQTDKKPSDIYLEVGFEDLAHFSRSFKNHFGKNPSEIKKC